MQRFVCVRSLGVLSVSALTTLCVCSTAAAQHHHPNHQNNGNNRGGGYYGGVSVISPGYGGYGFGGGPGYSSYGWSGGGLNYYRGPVGGWIGGGWFGGSGYPGYSSFNPGFGLYGPAAAEGLPVAYPPLPPTAPYAAPAGVGPLAGGAAPRLPVAQAHDPVPRQTNAEAKMRSLRVQTQGDEWFAKQNYLQAQSRYKQAIADAPDRAEPHFRLGFSLVALGYYAQGAAEFKRGLRIDPRWPETGDSLDRLYTDRNRMAKEATLHRTALWVNEDVRDPDRLFVLGLLLHFNGDVARSQPFLKAASQMAGGPDYIQAFLNAQPVNNQFLKSQIVHAQSQEPGPTPGPDSDPDAHDSVPNEKPVPVPIAVLRAPRSIRPASDSVQPAPSPESPAEESGPVLIVP